MGESWAVNGEWFHMMSQFSVQSEKVRNAYINVEAHVSLWYTECEDVYGWNGKTVCTWPTHLNGNGVKDDDSCLFTNNALKKFSICSNVKKCM